MSTTKEIRRIRCHDALVEMMKYSECVFFTLTTPDVVDVQEIRRRWRNLRHWLLRYLRQTTGRDVQYVSNYEIHPRGHGWHIHGVVNAFIPIKVLLAKGREFGFGRVNVKKVDSIGVSDYLSKHCLKAYRGVRNHLKGAVDGGGRLRLVNCSRGLPALYDYFYRSDHHEKVRSIFKELIPHTSTPLPVMRRLISERQKATPLEKDYFGVHDIDLDALKSRRISKFQMGRFWNLAEIGAMLGAKNSREMWLKLGGLVSVECSTWNNCKQSPLKVVQGELFHVEQFNVYNSVPRGTIES